MSTRCLIGMENSDNTINYIYCHWDGYPTGVGKTLLKSYTNINKIHSLISLGSMSVLDDELYPNPAYPHSFEYAMDSTGRYVPIRQEGVCLFYHRDRGDAWIDCAPQTVKSKRGYSVVGKNHWAVYLYLYTKDGEWQIRDMYDEKPTWKPLEQVVLAEEKEQKVNDISR